MIYFYGKEIAQNYAGNHIFKKVSVEIKAGDRIGIVGQNGAGKTTIAKIVAGTESPSAGVVGWKKGLKTAMIDQNPYYQDMLVKDVLLTPFSKLIEMEAERKRVEHVMSTSLSERKLSETLNQYAEIQEQYTNNGGYEYHALIRKVTAGLLLDNHLNHSWDSLSGGERSKVELACLLLKQPDLIVLDEPTNHLDLVAVDWLIQWLNQYDGSVLVVSHDRYFLDRVVTTVWEMDQGMLYEYQGNYSRFVQQKEERVLKEFQHYEDQQKKIKKMKETIKRLKEWANQANPPNASLHKQAKSMEKALNRIEVLQKPVQSKRVSFQFKQDQRSGQDVFKLEDVSFAFEQKTILHKANFVTYHRERVAIIGPNGAGKSTLLQLLRGKYSPIEGRVRIGSSLSIGYLSQHINELEGEQTVLDAYREYAHVEAGAARGKLAKFLFFGLDVFKKTRDLSGGERMRLRLAQLMEEHHNVLLLDEPTNHLDIDSREVLEDALVEFSGTVVAVSHDRYFLNQHFPVSYWLENGTITRYEGNVSYVQAKRKEACD
ncbi:ribosomal protection-like ABC-F family protein [Bacillus sp. Marseille-P3800]|uniref:ribosomal protection-like ABC-F family protein n=1 Tax=Bacillus sp. Marseille-P3800 TaxID=2014782 RepID=UPI000C0865E5|nr:ABC-F family ATP-binding cassette domain-containing protein [Bacillus sp. Marseille-P3800]